MEKDYADVEWGGEQLESQLKQAEFYKQYLSDYPKSNPQGTTDVRFGTRPSGGFGVQELLREKEKEKGLMALLQRLLPGGKTGMKEYQEGGQFPKYYGGGSVSEGSPTIASYFSQQGKTLGGSNTQSLSQLLGTK